MSNKTEILKAAIEDREAESFHYQIDIDNFEFARLRIARDFTGDDPVSVAMRAFDGELQDRILQARIEQAKTELIMRAMEESNYDLILEKEILISIQIVIFTC
jgi:hypothetical protein